MKKLSISILLLFVMILSITAVAAADDVTSDLAKSQTADDSIALAVDDGTDVLAGIDGGNFTQFQKDVDASSSPTITKDYTMKTGEKAIVISKEVRIVGSTINADGKGAIFNVTSTGKLYLTGVTLNNGNGTNGGAIYNDGEVVIQDANTFSTNNASLGGAIYNNGVITFEGSGAFSADTAKTGADIYNAKTGTFTIAKDSTFAGSVYNEGTMTIGASEFNGELVNNGTIDTITAAKLNGAVTNLGTITTLNTNNIAAPILNNGTITTVKGKTTEKITNNNKIGTINATIVELENNGEIAAIVDTTANGALLTNNGTIGDISKSDLGIFRNNGTVTSIDASTFTNTITNYENAKIGTIKNLVTDKKIVNEGTITTMDNVTVTGNFENYGEIVNINNCTLSTSRNYENASIGKISLTVFTKSLSNKANATIGLIEDSNITAKLINDGTITAIDNVTVGNHLENNGVIGTIIDSNAIALENAGNISAVTNFEIMGQTFENTGFIDTIDNLTAFGLQNWATGVIKTVTNSGFAGVENEGNITSISNTSFDFAGLDNSGNIASMLNVTFENDGTLENSGNITLIQDATFNATNIVNTGDMGIAFMDMFGITSGYAVSNSGNLTIIGATFTNNTASAVIYNKKNIVISDSSFDNNTCGRVISSQDGNLTILGGSFTNNNVTNKYLVITKNDTTIISDIKFANNSVSDYVIYAYSETVLSIASSTFDNNTAKVDCVNYNGIATITDSVFTNTNNTAISNYKGNLTLSGNTINTTSAKINNVGNGFITKVVITILNNGTENYNYYVDTNLTATLADDMGNLIYDEDAFAFYINGTKVADISEYNETTGIYKATFKAVNFENKNVTNADQVVTAKLNPNFVNCTADVKNATLKTIKGTFTELQTLIDNYGPDLTLKSDFAYDAAVDNVNLTKGVVINKAIKIDGNGTTISGSNVARIFFVNATADVVELRNITFANGNATNGAAIVANSSVRVYNSVFTNNVASANGGAIYDDVGAGKFVLVSNSKFANNGPNAIYVNSGNLNLINNTVNTNVADIVNFNGTINVAKVNVTILGNKTINATFSEKVTLNATITDENGNLINDPFFYFTVGGDKFAAKFDGSIYTADVVLSYKPNVYLVDIAYNKTNSISFNKKVGAYNISKENGTITIDARDVEMGKNATIFFEAFGDNGDNLNGTNITVSVNDVAYNVTIINGTGNLTLPVLDLGTYRVYANYAGDVNHNAMSQVVEFGVKIPTVMTVTATDITYDSALIKITLQSKGGDKLEGFVTLLVGDDAYRLPVQNGVGSQALTGLKPGVYTATAQFFDDPDYADATASTTFTIEAATVVADNIKRGVNSPYDYYVTVKDGNGNPIANKEVTIYVNGTKYTPKTNASGIATVAAGLTVVNETATVYDVIVVNPDTGANITATTTIVPRIVVLSGDLTADYLENPPYVVQAFGDDGNPVGEGEIVTVVFSGYFYYMPTNATGHVVRTIGLAPGLYAVKAGYKDYNASATIFSVKQILTASSGVLKKSAKSYTLKATLKSTNGKPLAGKEVKLTFNGKTYTVKTNAKGIASYKISSSVISKLSAGKTYKLTAKYVNDLTKGKYVGKIVVKK